MPSSPPSPGGREDLEALIELGQSAERDGRRAEARESFEAALRMIRLPSEAGLAVALPRWIGRTYLIDGEVDAAVDCTELSLAIAEAQQDVSGVASALNALANAFRQRGDLEEAVNLFGRARRKAVEAGDTRLMAMIEQNLGIIAAIRGDFAAALDHYQASLAAFRAEGIAEHASFVLNNMGMLFTDLHRWTEAEDAFQEALETAVSSGNTAAQIMIGVNRTELAIAQGQYDHAKRACDRAFKLATEKSDVRALGELLKHYGVICRETDQLSSAEAYLAQAAKLAREGDDLLLAAEVSREEADLFSRQGRNHDTLRSLNEAHKLFERLQARRDVADIGGRILSLQDRFVELVRRWGESIESADRYTHGHCERVADFACTLARSVGFDEKNLFWFRLGALLHDVGKIIVPADVLNKPGKLTPEERAIMERHPDAGVALLAEIDFPWDIRPMLRHHHERWVGGGYPAGLEGEAIPLAARILCIADVFDALTSVRPYRGAKTIEEAIEIMTGDMASHFDPMLLERWQELCQAGLPSELAAERSRAGVGDAGAARPGESTLAAGDGTLRILVVAQNFSDAGLIRAAACEHSVDVEVVHVARLTDVLYRLQDTSFAAILLGLPLQSGQEIQGLAFLQEHAPEVPVVVLADSLNEGLARQAIQRGAQDFLVRGELAGAMLLRTIRHAIERNQLRIELEARSLLDELTALYNRRGFFATASEHLKLASRRRDRGAVIFADVNGFKQINDRFGHREGDQALMDVSTLLKSTFRQSDILARLGGDEFVALVSGVGPGAVATLTDRLDKHLDLYNAYAGRRYQLSLSVGSAIFDPLEPTTIEELLRLADQSMYEQKLSGRERNPLDVAALAAGAAPGH